MDMDVANLAVVEDSKQVNDSVDGQDLVARKTGLGTLMKAAKQTAQVPEFDMNAFF